MSLRNRLLAAFIIPLAIASLAALGLSQTLDHSVRAANDIAQDQRTVAAIQSVINTALDAETGVRGFALTDEDRFLEPYESARAAFPLRARDLRQLVSGSADGTGRVDRIEALFQQWLRDTAEPAILARRHSPFQLVRHAARLRTLALRMRLPGTNPTSALDPLTNATLVDATEQELKELLGRNLPDDLRKSWKAMVPFLQGVRDACASGGASGPRCDREIVAFQARIDTLADDAWGRRDKALSIQSADTGKATLDAIRGEATELTRAVEKHLSGLVTENNELTRRRGRLGMATLAATLVLSMLIALATTLRTTRSATSLIEAARAIARGELDRRAPVQTEDELGELARTFNMMAERLQDRDHESALLAELGDMLQACLTLEEAAVVIGRIGPRLFPKAMGEIFLFNASRNLVISTARWQDAAARTPPWNPQDCWALRRGQPHRSDVTGSSAPCPHFGAELPAIALCIPLTAHGEAIGVLSLRAEERTTPNRPVLESPERMRFVRAAGEHVGLALANLQLRDALRQQAIRDPLTGLFNRRYAEETLERELARIKRTASAMTLVMLDVDHFKRFNDTFGHDAGDAVLRALGELLRTQLRTSDLACRYGGEEFLLALIDAPAEAALPRLEQIRGACARLNLTQAGRALGSITLSMGVVEGPLQGDGVAALITAADGALYQAKKDGRDRIRRAG